MDVDSVSATGPQIPQAQPSASDPVAPPDTLPTSLLSASATAKPGAHTSQSAACALAAGQAETPATVAAIESALGALNIAEQKSTEQKSTEQKSTEQKQIRKVVSQWVGDPKKQIKSTVETWAGQQTSLIPSSTEENHVAEAKNEAAAITKDLQAALKDKNIDTKKIKALSKIVIETAVKISETKPKVAKEILHIFQEALNADIDTEKNEALSKTAIKTAVKISKTKPKVAKEILHILQESKECQLYIANKIFDKMQKSESFKKVVGEFLQEFIPFHVQITREQELFRQTQEVAPRLMTLIQNRNLLTNALKSELNKFGNETFTTQVGGAYVSVEAKKIMDEITKCVNLLTASMENIESPLKEMYKTLYESVAKKCGAEEASKHLASFVFLKTIVPTIRGVGLDVGIGKKDFTTALMIYIADTSKEQTKPLWTTPNKDNPMETLEMCFKLESRIAVTAFVKQVLKACGITQKPSGPIASSSSRP